MYITPHLYFSYRFPRAANKVRHNAIAANDRIYCRVHCHLHRNRHDGGGRDAKGTADRAGYGPQHTGERRARRGPGGDERAGF